MPPSLTGSAESDYPICYLIAILISLIAAVESLDCVSMTLMTAALISTSLAFLNRACPIRLLYEQQSAGGRFST
jgi:hypothetical protein